MIQINKIGTDPEFVVLDADKNLASAIDFLPGTKDLPFDLGGGTSVQVDNVMAEFCVPPTKSPRDLWEALCYAKNEALKFLPAGYSFATIASAQYPQNLLDNPIAQTFGCEPDFTPYIPLESQAIPQANKIAIADTFIQNPKPTCDDKSLRSCGGHIHLDIISEAVIDEGRFINPHLKNNLALLCDIFLGIPSILEDSDTRRRLLYGKPGAFRPKSYGIEYRVLSNYWLESLDTITAIFNRIEHINCLFVNSNLKNHAFHINNGYLSPFYNEFKIRSNEDLINIITNNDTKMASRMCDWLKIKTLTLKTV